MVYPVLQRRLDIDLNDASWKVQAIDERATDILGPVDFGWHCYNEDPDSFTFGEGLLAGSSIPGSRRLVFCAHSRQWDGFYISSMGGAAYTFHGVGASYVCLRGRCAKPSVLLLNHRNGEIAVRVEPVDVEALWAGYAGPDDDSLIGFFALQQALLDRFKDEYPPRRVRIFAVGPAAMVTPEGAIGSSPVNDGTLSAVVDWCGRGGLGSRLVQRHNVVACVFGGEWVDPDLPVSKELDGYFIEHFGQKVVKTDLAVTEKYRYHKEFKTGGTFGVNMYEISDRLLTHNYRSIYADAEERRAQHKSFILDHYLKQFNEETIQSKQFQHCGEPCAVACKKLNGKYKKDYEPYHTLGPQVGVFDQRAAELLNDYADAMGFDAIQSGGTLAWIMECVADGLMDAEAFGFPPASELSFTYHSDTDGFDLVEDSMRNAVYAIAVLKAILYDERANLFCQGIRAAAETLDGQNGTRTVDRAVFLAHGESGYMVPNQYWVPGMGSPMPIMGKYYVYYGPDFMAPEALGRKNVERMVYELFSDNTGICRFHRKWSESITDEILKAHYELPVDYKAHQFKLAAAINEQEAHKSVPWQSERIADLLLEFLRFWGDFGLKDENLHYWLGRANEDKMAAAGDFWSAILRGQAEAFGGGPESIPDILTPAQAEKSTPI